VTNQSEWRWAEPTGQQRLVREDELRAALAAGVIPSNAPVWRPGWKQWKPASEVEELKEPVDGVPAPPMFVVVAQNQFEGKGAATEEPPPPPRYVPAGVTTKPMVPPHHPPSGPTLVDPPRAEPKPKPVASPFVKKPLAPGEDTITKTAPMPMGTKTAAPKAAKPPAKPATSKPPPLPKKAKSVAPPPGPRAPSMDQFIVQGQPPAKKSIPPPLPAAAKKSTAPPPLPAAAKKSTAPPPLPTKTAPSEPAPFSSGRHTLPVAPAPPPLPKIDPIYAAPPEPVPEPAPIPQSKFPTLMMFGEEPKPSPAKPPDEAPPIIVPPPEPSNITSTNVVTRPPPWGEGAVGIADNIPKAPSSPMFPPTEDRPSDAPRPQELSSSDLTSASRLEVVKPAPLVAAERPRTMMGLGPDLLAKNREEVERKKEVVAAPPPEPASPDDTAQQPSPFLPSAPASGAKIHDLREIARKRLSDANVLARKSASQAGVLAKRAYATARERTKDKPPWFLPAVGGGAFVVLVGLIALVVHGVSGGSSTAGSASAAPSAGSSAPTTAKTTAGTTTAPPQPARPIQCALSGAPRTVAPKALVPSGVEVTRLGSQIALGFATGPKEGVLELLDPSSGASASSLHLPAHDPIRRVLAFGEDKPQAALDSDRKGDRIQGRRTLRANPPIDLGAMDGGLVWAAHGTDKGIKLWSLASDGPVEAIRGEALPDNKGFAVFLSAFGGNPPAPLGPLLRVDGLGPQIGSPAIAASGDKVMVTWADRAGTSDPWGLRYAVIHVGDEAIHAQSFTLPPGGLGEQGMSPGLSALSGGRFLLLWTEGQVSSHQVRGAVFDGSQARGAFNASAEGVNAGQGQGAVLPDGHGVVAFLAGSGKSFEVVATPITCTEK